MATSFRPNLKWSFQIQAHSRRSSSSKASPYASKGREASFGSGRLSFFSSICEEGEFIPRETFKTYTCLSEAPQTSADDLLDLKEIEINNKARPLGHLHYGLKCTRPSRVDDNFSAGTSLPTGKASSFGMLMKNIDVLEETFAESGMLSLGRDGQNDLAIEDGGYHNVHPKTDGQNDDVVVYSGKRAGRRSVKKRAVDNADKVASQPLTTRAAKEKFRNSSIFSRKRAFKRPTVARNEVEISTGVKVVANLERIRETLEKETGKISSMSCWANAAGVDIKDLQKQLQFGWFCQDELLRTTNSLVRFLSKKYRCSGLPMEDLVQAGAVGVLQGVERFDPKRGFRFSTYIHYWIRKSMSSVVARNSRVVIDQGNESDRKALNNGSSRYSDDDIAKATGLPLAKEFTADTSIQSPEETVTRKLMKIDIFNLLEGLESRERQVLLMR
ncbi:RNA polymerase sigma factor sigC-like isoform X2 [Cucurbita pepo subsp. pepo]|uniref:RNA polymerase sigma factor sigC-like isoform X2 n=1 Tax=Cucurbita pepo subsp. pepo TaxID=3664 RepID=UPI000C9D3423|nr:RNA polymerase sigma factor sigC-like isoform X2 [Cucurbita pepo subsp. pepo]